MNLMLTATCDNTDAFYQSYLSMKPEFADWCDISRCAFGKIDDTNLVELFFDVDGPKLKPGLPSLRPKKRSRSTISYQHGTHLNRSKWVERV